MNRPPIGVKPRYLVMEERFQELKQAIQQYSERGHIIPLEWVDEYNELIKSISSEQFKYHYTNMPKYKDPPPPPEDRVLEEGEIPRKPLPVIKKTR